MVTSLREKGPYSEFSILQFPALGLNYGVPSVLQENIYLSVSLRMQENTNTDTFPAGYTIVYSGYRKNIRKRRIAEALTIKAIRPSFNAKEISPEFKFFN